MTAIEQELGNVNKGAVRRILERVTAYEVSIPRIDVEVEEQMIYEKISGRWKSLVEWFVGKEGQESEAGKVFDTTHQSAACLCSRLCQRVAQACRIASFRFAERRS